MKRLFIILLLLTSCAVLKYVPSEVEWQLDMSSKPTVDKYFFTQNKTFYNNNSVLFMDSMVTVTDSGLVIRCIRQPGKATTWQKTDSFQFVSGMIQSWNKDTAWHTKLVEKGGTWIVTARIPRSWSALWLLHPDYSVAGYDTRKFIIPEVDFAENNGNRIDNCVHYGYSDSVYNTHSLVRLMHRPDGRLHEYAVKILPGGYDFYLDGIRKTRYRGRGRDGFTAYSQPYYLVINNASDTRFNADSTALLVKRVAYISAGRKK